MDEPGNDVMWYFSENHALLFHTACHLAGTLLPEATFVRSGRTGREQAEIGRQRLLEWLTHFEACEMAEWNSAPYFPIDLKGLCALHALSPDEGIRQRSGAAIRRLLEIVALSSHHGLITASQGRSYEHTLRPGRSLELSAIARLAFGRGGLGRRFHALPQLALCFARHGLSIDPKLAAFADHSDDTAYEWRYKQGENGIASLYHFKTSDFAMGSIAHYRWGEWGYQETILHLRLGERPESQIWINHPGEVIHSGYGRPSYWGGCGTVPRTHQYRALAVLDFEIHPTQPDFSHAWVPEAEMDEVVYDKDRILVRVRQRALPAAGQRRLRASGGWPDRRVRGAPSRPPRPLDRPPVGPPARGQPSSLRGALPRPDLFRARRHAVAHRSGLRGSRLRRRRRDPHGARRARPQGLDDFGRTRHAAVWSSRGTALTRKLAGIGSEVSLNKRISGRRS